MILRDVWTGSRAISKETSSFASSPHGEFALISKLTNRSCADTSARIADGLAFSTLVLPARTQPQNGRVVASSFQPRLKPFQLMLGRLPALLAVGIGCSIMHARGSSRACQCDFLARSLRDTLAPDCSAARRCASQSSCSAVENLRHLVT
jgi:hypothetical protein